MSPRLRQLLIALLVLLSAAAAQLAIDLGGDPPTSTTTWPTITSLPTLPPTSTTGPPASTTSSAPTSTTVATTTTTAAPPTTVSTTFPPAVRCRDEGIPRFDILVGGFGDATVESGIWWAAPYCRTLPFRDRVEWIDGDREGYRCAHMFLTRDGVLVGRVWFVRIPPPPGGVVYAGVGDRYMDEGVRWYNGEPANAGRELGDCPDPSVRYETSPDLIDQRPTIAYVDPQGLLEVRDYKVTKVPESVRFSVPQVIDAPFPDAGRKSAEHTVHSRVIVVANVLTDNGDWAPAVGIYYDSLHPDTTVTTDIGGT